MVGTKLAAEINKYLGIPYFTNKGKYKNHGDNVFVGKGTAKDIALTTIDLANKENIKLVDLTPKHLYNFQKKHHLGIDCSGLACHLLNFLFNLNLDPRKTSADMLTSLPLSRKIKLNTIRTGDLIRQENGHHVLFILDKNEDTINYIDSSVKGRGVRYGSLPTSPLPALYRLKAVKK